MLFINRTSFTVVLNNKRVEICFLFRSINQKKIRIPILMKIRLQLASLLFHDTTSEILTYHSTQISHAKCLKNVYVKTHCGLAKFLKGVVSIIHCIHNILRRQHRRTSTGDCQISVLDIVSIHND